MSIVFLLVPFATFLGIFFLGAFIWAARRGQFDDLISPAHRILIEEKSLTKNQNISASGGEHVRE